MDPARAGELLARERERIEQTLHAVSGEGAGDDPDPTHEAPDLYEVEVDQGREEDLSDQLAAVERAEGRLAAGTYGLSVESGEPIPDGRLEAEPTAERTVEEQERFDRGA